MKMVKFTVLAIVCFLVPMLSNAGAPCPVNSCNPYNSCTQGCYIQEISGVSNCIPQNPSKAEENAKQTARNTGYGKCSQGYFLQSKWVLKQYVVGQQCFVSAEVEISCYN